MTREESIKTWYLISEVRAAYKNGRDFTTIGLRNIIFEPDDEKLLDLKGADFRGCDLSSVEFYLCDLQGADFTGAELCGCEFIDCFFGDKSNIKTIMTRDNNIRAHVRCCSINDILSEEIGHCYNIWGIRKPLDTTGQELIGYKIVAVFEEEPVLAIAKLLIPADSRRIVFKEEKCRCEKATVLDIYSIDKKNHYKAARSIMYDKTFLYGLGTEVCADSFDEDVSAVCAHGIHFFLTEEEAIEYSGEF